MPKVKQNTKMKRRKVNTGYLGIYFKKIKYIYIFKKGLTNWPKATEIQEKKASFLLKHR